MNPPGSSAPDTAAPPGPRIRVLTHGMARLLLIASLLVFAAGVQLFVFTEQTDKYFAWTVGVPLTAAFLGAGYWASVLFEWFAVRAQTWVGARIAIPSVFVFTTLTLVATLLHLDQFHLASSLPIVTRVLTWLWIVVYAFVPVAMLLLFVRQARLAGEDPPREHPLPGWLRAGLAVQAGVMFVVGASLFVTPDSSSTLWPWPLTPLTARAVGAWLIGMGVAAAHAFVENDVLRVRVASVAYVAFGALQLVALARYPATPNWEALPAWAYLVFLLLTLGLHVTVVALSRARRPVVATDPK